MSHGIGLFIAHAIIKAIIYGTVWHLMRGQPVWVDLLVGAGVVMLLAFMTGRCRSY